MRLGYFHNYAKEAMKPILLVINLGNPEGIVSVHTFLLYSELVFALLASFVAEEKMYLQLLACLFL